MERRALIKYVRAFEVKGGILGSLSHRVRVVEKKMRVP